MDPLYNSPYYAIPTVEEGRDAASWWRSINHMIQSPQDRDNITISKVEWFKSLEGLGHELLIFTVDVAEPDYIAFLVIERCTNLEIVDDALKQNQITQLLPGSITASIKESDISKIRERLRADLSAELKLIPFRAAKSPSNQISGSSTYPLSSRICTNQQFTACDNIARADMEYGVGPTGSDLSSKKLETLIFDKPGAPKFTLRDLGIMLREIHNLRPNYTLWSHNCFWFARTLVDVITKMKSPSPSTPELVNTLAGHVYNVGELGRIIGSNPTEVNQLVAGIEIAIEADDQRVIEVWEAKSSEMAKAKAAFAALAVTEDKLAVSENVCTVLEETILRIRKENEQKMGAMEAEIKRLQGQLRLTDAKQVEEK